MTAGGAAPRGGATGAVGFPDVEATLDHEGRDGLLVGAKRQDQQRARMARRQPRVGDGLLNGSREIEQPDGIRDAGAAATEPERYRLMGEAEGVGEPGVGRGLLHRVEIGPHQVLCQRHLELVAARFGGRPDDRRDACDPRELGSSKAPLTRHEAVRVAFSLHHDRV